MAKSETKPSVLSHLRDILILPFTVTIVIPYFLYDNSENLIPHNAIFKLFGTLLIVFGVTLFVITVALFVKVGQGTLAPWSPTQKLIVRGPYRYCRNPMITGVLFILIGESLILHSTSILIWSGIFSIVNTIYFIFSEEPELHKRFGQQYANYKRHVPRWIPNIFPYRPEDVEANR